MIRRERDIDGNITYINENDEKIGGGWFSSIVSKIGSDATKKIAKETVKKAGEKFLKDGSEKLGKKMMNSGLKQIESKISKKEIEQKKKVLPKLNVEPEIAGDKIVKLLQEYNNNKKDLPKQLDQETKYADISRKFDELLI